MLHTIRQAAAVASPPRSIILHMRHAGSPGRDFMIQEFLGILTRLSRFSDSIGARFRHVGSSGQPVTPPPPGAVTRDLRGDSWHIQLDLTPQVLSPDIPRETTWDEERKNSRPRVTGFRMASSPLRGSRSRRSSSTRSLRGRGARGGGPQSKAADVARPRRASDRRRCALRRAGRPALG